MNAGGRVRTFVAAKAQGPKPCTFDHSATPADRGLLRR